MLRELTLGHNPARPSLKLCLPGVSVSASLIVREMQMKTTMGCDLMYIRMAIIRRRKGGKGERRVEEIISVGKDVEKLEPLHTASESVK